MNGPPQMSRQTVAETLSSSSSNLSSGGSMDISTIDASGLLQTLQGHVEDVRSLLQCGICVRPLYEPYTLACGHTFCYGCLTSWFSSGRSSKTCPDCRALVKSQPAPAYLVRAIVQMFTSHAELLEKGETTTQHTANRRDEAERLEADRANTHPRTGGLFQGSFKERLPLGRPIVDLEDNVTRCPICSWELEEIGCSHCGYGLDAETVTGSESEENSEMTDYIDDMDDGFGDLEDDLAWNEFYDGIPFEELPFGLEQLHGERLRLHHHHHHPLYRGPYGLFPPSVSSAAHDDSGDEDESDDDEFDDEMDSFIDDDEVREDGSDSDRSTVVGDHSYTAHDPDNDAGGGSDVSMSHDAGESSGDSGEESSEDEDAIRPPIASSSRRQLQPGPAQGDSDSHLRSPPASHILRANDTNHQDHQGSSEDNANRSSPSDHQHRVSPPSPVGASANDAIPVEDDSDDDIPVRPTRRNRTRTRNRRNRR